MNKLPLAKRAQILGLLVEGNSLRAASRLADCSINTVTKLLVDVGAACAEHQDKTLRNLSCKRVQCDEIWSFVYAKAKNVTSAKAAPHDAGDVWTWTAIDADSKLVASWMVGNRDGAAAKVFIADLASRLANRVQLTTDGHKPYLKAVENSFGADIDYAMLVKLYGEPKGAAGRAPLQPRRVLWDDCWNRDRRPRSEVHLYELRRAPESHHADEHAPFHAPDQCVLEEG
jgi:IS1 family transposase